MRKIKLNIFKLLRFLGFFRLALWLTRKQLRIFCYHGFSLDDEHLFMPGLFMHIETFKRRLALINKYQVKIVDLAEAVEQQMHNQITTPSAVLTFDDGFISTFDQALPLLKQEHKTATIYLTTYYQQKQAPIFRLAVQYLFWKKAPTTKQLQSCCPHIEFTTQQDDNKWKIIEYGETQLSQKQRQELWEQLRNIVQLELSAKQREAFMQLDRAENIKQALQDGFRIEYHTHRHRFPQDTVLCKQEILENKAIIENITAITPEHFCYPSGLWQDHHPGILKDLAIKTATTCDPGLVTANSNPLLLPRFLDSDIKEDIEFEADLCGVTNYILKIKHLLGIDTRTY